MDDIVFISSSIEKCQPFLEQYLNSLTGVVDDFWEEHIINAQFYAIVQNGIPIGCFAVYRTHKLTLFTIGTDRLHLAQPVMKRILDEFRIETAFVVTCDELFLSLCLDYHQKIEPQAYFFEGTTRAGVRMPEYGRECILPVSGAELEEVQLRTGDFFDFVTEADLNSGRTFLYKLETGGEILGYGILAPNRLKKEYWDCGMIALEAHRRKGVGRSLQYHLAELCRERGGIPVSGCWYYNHLSKKTIESAGRSTKTRLLNVIFKEKDDGRK